MTTTDKNRTAALQFAFDTYTSNADGLTAVEALALTDAEWNERVSVWEPFENWERADVVSSIEDTATALEQNFIPR